MHLNRCASMCNTQFILLIEPAWICRSPPGLCGPRQGRPVDDDHGSQTPPSPASCNSMTRDMKAMSRSSPVSWASARVSEKVNAKGSEDYVVHVHALYFYYSHHPAIFRKWEGFQLGHPGWRGRALLQGTVARKGCSLPGRVHWEIYDDNFPADGSKVS